jgi:hypothetical protein
MKCVSCGIIGPFTICVLHRWGILLRRRQTAATRTDTRTNNVTTPATLALIVVGGLNINVTCKTKNELAQRTMCHVKNVGLFFFINFIRLACVFVFGELL